VDPVITVFIARQGKDYVEVYSCGRGSYVAPHKYALANLLNHLPNAYIDLNSLITARPQAVLEDPGLDLTNLPAPVQFCDTPDCIEIPLGESIVALLPQGYDEAFLQHLRSSVVTLDFPMLRLRFIEWIARERLMMARERAFTPRPHHPR
jgi:hypothetical protein